MLQDSKIDEQKAISWCGIVFTVVKINLLGPRVAGPGLEIWAGLLGSPWLNLGWPNAACAKLDNCQQKKKIPQKTQKLATPKAPNKPQKSHFDKFKHFPGKIRFA